MDDNVRPQWVVVTAMCSVSVLEYVHIQKTQWEVCVSVCLCYVRLQRETAVCLFWIILDYRMGTQRCGLPLSHTYTDRHVRYTQSDKYKSQYCLVCISWILNIHVLGGIVDLTRWLLKIVSVWYVAFVIIPYLYIFTYCTIIGLHIVLLNSTKKVLVYFYCWELQHNMIFIYCTYIYRCKNHTSGHTHQWRFINGFNVRTIEMITAKRRTVRADQNTNLHK